MSDNINNSIYGNLQDPTSVGISGIDKLEDRQKEYIDEGLKNMRAVANNYTAYMSEYIKNKPAVEYTGFVGLNDSRYDKYAKTSEDFADLNELRAYEQSALNKIASGIAKFGVLAGTTFLDGTVGLVTGIISSAANKDISKMWNNEVSQALNNINEWAEQAMPNYYTKDERENPLALRNIFSANFIGDKFIKNLGFTVGALYSGGVASSALRNITNGVMTGAKRLGMITKNIKDITKASNAVSGVVGSIVGGYNEARVEALTNSKDFRDNNIASLNNEYFGDANINPMQVQLAKETLENGLKDGTIEDTSQLEQHIKRLNDYLDSYNRINEDADKMGNMIMFTEGPLLALSNGMQFFRYLSGGYDTASRVSNNIGGNIGNFINTAKKPSKTPIKYITKNLITEGGEEWSQELIKNIAEEGYSQSLNNYYKKLKDPKANEDAINWINAVSVGLSKTVGDESAIEQFIVGGLTGALGIPRFRSLRGENGKLRFPITWANEGYNDWKEDKKLYEDTEQLVNNMNNIVGSDKFKNYFNNLVIHIGEEKEKENSLIDNDKFSFKNSEFSQLLQTFITFDNAGKLEDLNSFLEQVTDISSDDTLNDIVKNTTKKDDDGKLVGPFAEYATLDEAGNIIANLTTQVSRNNVKEKLNSNKQKIFDVLNTYKKAKDDVIDMSGDTFKGDNFNELVWMKSMIYNFEDRFHSISNNDLKNEFVKISDALKHYRDKAINTLNNENGRLNKKSNKKDAKKIKEINDNIDSIQDTIDYYNDIINDIETLFTRLTENDSKSRKEDIYNDHSLTEKILSDYLVNTRNIYSKALKALFPNAITDSIKKEKSTPEFLEYTLNSASRTFDDLDKLIKSIKEFRKTYNEYISNPNKQIEDHNKIDEEVKQESIDIKSQTYIDKLNNIDDYIEFKDVIDSIDDPSIKDSIINNESLKEKKKDYIDKYMGQNKFRAHVISNLKNMDLENNDVEDAILLFDNHYRKSKDVDDINNVDAETLNDVTLFEDNTTTDPNYDPNARLVKAKYNVQQAMNKAIKDSIAIENIPNNIGVSIVNDDKSIYTKNSDSDEVFENVTLDLKGMLGMNADTLNLIQRNIDTSKPTKVIVKNNTITLFYGEHTAVIEDPDKVEKVSKQLDKYRTVKEDKDSSAETTTVDEVIDNSKEDKDTISSTTEEETTGMSETPIVNSVTLEDVEKGKKDENEQGSEEEPDIIESVNTQVVTTDDNEQDTIEEFVVRSENPEEVIQEPPTDSEIKDEIEKIKEESNEDDKSVGEPEKTPNGDDTFFNYYRPVIPEIHQSAWYTNNDFRDFPIVALEIAFYNWYNKLSKNEQGAINKYLDENKNVPKTPEIIKNVLGNLYKDQSNKLDLINKDYNRYNKDFSIIYNYLKTNGAFDYVNEGKLKEGQKVFFMIDPEFEDKVKDMIWHKGKRTIFMVVKDDDGNYQIVGSLDETDSSVKKYLNLQKLRDKVTNEYEEYIANNSTNERFISPNISVNVTKIINGKTQITKSEEKSLNDIPNIGDNPLFYIEPKDPSKQNSDIKSKIVTTKKLKVGSMYLLIPLSNNKYRAIPIRAKKFNRENFNIDDISFQNTYVYKTLVNNLNNIVDTIIKTNGDKSNWSNKTKDQKIKDFVQYINNINTVLNISDINISPFYGKKGFGITLSKNLRNSDNTIKRDRNDKILVGDFKNIYFNGFEGIKSIDTIVNDIISALYEYDLYMQLNIKNINNGSYNTDIINSGSLYTNIIDTKLKSAWFITDIYREGDEILPEGEALEKKKKVYDQSIPTTPISIDTNNTNNIDGTSTVENTVDVTIDIRGKNSTYKVQIGNSTSDLIVFNEKGEQLKSTSSIYKKVINKYKEQLEQNATIEIPFAQPDIQSEEQPVEQQNNTNTVIGDSIIDDNNIQQINSTITTDAITGSTTDSITEDVSENNNIQTLITVNSNKKIRRHKKTNTIENKIFDKEKELKWVNRVLPQLTEQDRIKFIDGLINVADSDAKAWGMFDGYMVTLSNIAVEGTTYHEAFHAVFNLMMNDIEKNNLLDEYRKKYRNDNDNELEERMAEDFKEFVLNGGIDTRSLGRKIIDFFKSLFIKTKYWKNFRPSAVYYFRAINEGKYSNKGISITTSGNNRYKQEEYTQEMKDILAKAPRDSQGRLLAPNGRPSNLTERQYAQVRTKEFKNWFGDWEKIAPKKEFKKTLYRGQSAKPIIDSDGNLVLKATYDNLWKGYGLSFANSEEYAEDYGKRSSHSPYIIKIDQDYLDKILPLVEEAGTKGNNIRSIGDEYNEKDREERLLFEGDIKIPKQYYTIEEPSLPISENTYQAGIDYLQAEDYFSIADELPFSSTKDKWSFDEIKILYDDFIKRFPNETAARAYLYEIEQNIETIGIINYEKSFNEYLESEESPDGDVFVKYIGPKPINNVTQSTKASKVVDENGEPLVVYHRSPKQFNKFDFNKLGSTTDNSGISSEDNKLGFFFTSERNLYDNYKNILGNNIYEVFLNIKNPQSYMPITMNTNEQDIPKIIKDTHDKYDGIKYVKYMDNEIDFDDEGRLFAIGGRYEFVVFNPNQIKSATDNIGTFDTNNPDIRYSIAKERQEVLSNNKYIQTNRLNYNKLSNNTKYELNNIGISEEIYNNMSDIEREYIINCHAFI